MPYNHKTNVVLIGMPGSGKSTVGVILAKLITKRYMDTDILIQNHTGKSLQEIVNDEGHMKLRQIEEKTLLSVDCENHIIATGGSAAYSHPAMEHLRANGVIVFLKADLDALRARIHNYETRGLAKRPDQSFQDLFAERDVLYKKYAEIIVDCSRLTQDQVAEEIAEQLHRYQHSATITPRDELSEKLTVA